MSKQTNNDVWRSPSLVLHFIANKFVYIYLFAQLIFQMNNLENKTIPWKRWQGKSCNWFIDRLTMLEGCPCPRKLLLITRFCLATIRFLGNFEQYYWYSSVMGAPENRAKPRNILSVQRIKLTLMIWYICIYSCKNRSKWALRLYHHLRIFHAAPVADTENTTHFKWLLFTGFELLTIPFRSLLANEKLQLFTMFPWIITYTLFICFTSACLRAM